MRIDKAREQRIAAAVDHLRIGSWSEVRPDRDDFAIRDRDAVGLDDSLAIEDSNIAYDECIARRSPRRCRRADDEAHTNRGYDSDYSANH